MARPAPFDSLAARLVADSRDVDLLWQIAILAACALAAWAAIHLIQPRLRDADAVWLAGREGARRVGFPALMLLALLVGRDVAQHWLDNTHLLDLAVPLLLSLIAVRLIVYALRYAFEPRDSLKLWERTAAWLIWGLFALHITDLLPRIHDAMEALSFQSGNARFSLWLLFQATLVVIVAVVAALAVARLVESRLMAFTQVNLSLRIALSKGIRSLFLILAVLVALPAVGIDLTVLSVFGGALGVGIGFGLQKVASNYVSGFIILLDRSVRIGDLVTVDGKYGAVSRINTRYTLLRSSDGTESIVPNETLITQTVINHSLTRPNIRVAIPIQVAYDTDLEQAETLLLDVARAHPKVLQDSDALPKVLLKDFADNGINLELGVWVGDPNAASGLRSDINWAIWRRFKAANIEIPFPQRVVHMVAQPGGEQEKP